ncbi:MAG: histidine--tRNA ligase [Clostridiaceae bacterium]|nr:histidine--tRNA ligase [Clostridiaceae bacterium]
MQNLKGTKDYLPEEQVVRNNIKQTLERVFCLYGFKPIETPMLCYYDLLASKYSGGAEILKEVYKLQDQGKRDLGLRYDLTIPFAKLIGMNKEIRMPFKRYEIGKVFRDGPIKVGRNREFTQCDVDVVGIKATLAEAELIEMAMEAFKRLKIDVYIEYNNRKLLTGFLRVMGIKDEKMNEVILSLDKIEKIGVEGVKEEVVSKGIEPEIIKEILRIAVDKEKRTLEYYKANYNEELLNEGVKELEELQGYIRAFELDNKTLFNPFLARGLDIYTGTVYEIFLEDRSITSSIGGGGRYNKIIGEFLNEEKEYPAVGMSFGLDVIFAAMSLKERAENLCFIDIFVIPMNTEKEALKLAASLRKMGYRVDMEMMGKKLKKSLDYANKENIPFVIVLGENELKDGIIKLKDMKIGKDIEIPLDNLVLIKERLNYD